jgi:hypothetical protein
VEIGDHQQVNENDREDDAEAQAAERLIHGVALTANRDARAGRQGAEIVDGVLHGSGGAAEVTALDTAINVDDALHVVMVEDGGFGVLRDSREVREQLRVGADARRG